jgi:membrane-associated phospholipid phosphatase
MRDEGLKESLILHPSSFIPMEADLVIKLQQFLSSPAWRMLTGFAARWLIFLFIPFAFFVKKSARLRDAVYAAAWSALLALTMSTVLAQIIGRLRPFMAVSGIEAVVPLNAQEGSFPSSHTAAAVGIAMALSYVNAPVRVTVILMAILIALGRMAAGMHYPTDVIGGAAVGVLAFVIVQKVREGLRKV